MLSLAIIFQNVIPLIKKGSILKKDYFNPNNFFDKIYLLTFDGAVPDEMVESIKLAFGNAKFFVIPIGGFNLHNVYLKRYQILNIIKKINPDIIRSFSPQIDGYLATFCGNKLGIPVVVSLHGDRDRDNRYNMITEKQYFKYLISLVHKYLFEIPALRKGNKIIAVYEFAAEYGQRYSKKPVTVIYNKVDTNYFIPSEHHETKNPFTIINVGRLIPAKNQEVLIRAMKNVDGKLILIGNGPMYNSYTDLIKKLDLDEKIEIITSVPNNKLVTYYQKSDIYATGIQYGGIAVPVLEAMACGLPIVQCPYPFGSTPEFIDEAGLIVECSPDGFAEGINQLKNNPDMLKKKSEFARNKMLKYNKEKMDALEVEVYRDLIR